MTSAGLQNVRTASIRVALATTAVVAVAYLLIAFAVVAITTQNLTAQIDARLADTLAHTSRGGGGPGGGPGGGGGGGFQPPDRGTPFNAPYIVWTIQTDGTVMTSNPLAVLPAEYYTVTTPTTISIGDDSVRIMGMTTADGDQVVIGQTMAPVSQAQQTIILAELLIGPILLVIVFFGAVAIGRRVAAPIEAAHQRQLEFTADASHELRTPLSVIEAHTTLALAQDRDAEWYRRAFGRVDQESKRIRRLLDDLLWLARFDATMGQPNAEPVDIGILADQAVDRFGIVAEARHLDLAVRADAGSLVVNAPPEWLDRLLGVLLDNACRYSPEGGTVRVTAASEGSRIRLTVDDSGPGIPVEERDRIFDRFHRATNSPGGAGLGLAIADAIVRATNGRWRVDSSPSGGASMSVTWPRAFAGPREAASSAPASSASSQSLPAD